MIKPSSDSKLLRVGYQTMATELLTPNHAGPLPQPRTLSLESPYQGVALGDLEHRDFDTTLFVINRVAALYLKSSLQGEPDHIAQKTHLLEGQIDQFRAYEADFTHYPPEAGCIAERYIQNERGAEDMEARVAARLGNLDPYLVTDLDGTITEDPTQYLDKIPGSRIGEPFLAQKGRDSFAEVHARVWQPLLRDAPTLFEKAGKHAPLRKGVDRFFQYANERELKQTVLSANFEPFVHNVITKIPTAEYVSIYAVTADSITSTDKGTMIRHLAKTDPKRAVIFIGDGSSDIPSLEAQEYVACYFALENSSFAKALKERNLPHFTYRDFDDIRLQLSRFETNSKEELAA